MTRNEKVFLKQLEKLQRTAKADLKRLEGFNAKYPGNLRADKLKKMRLERIYTSLTLREVIRAFHQEIVDPREDRYVHIAVVKRLRAEREALQKEVAHLKQAIHMSELVAA